MSEKRGLAAYDIDGTIMRDAYFERAFWGMKDKGLVEDPEELLSEIELQRYKHPKSDEYILEMIEHYTRCTRGFDIKNLETFAEEFAEEEVENIYPEMRERLEQDKDDNLRLVLITGTPVQLLKPFARRLDSDLYFGSKYYEDGGRIHETRDNISRGGGEQKERILGKLAAITKLDVERAYGNTMSDYPMLKMAVGAYAVNPTADLRAAAIERDWGIIDCEEEEKYDR